MSDPAHILLVEDSELVTGAMTILFESAGYRLSAAASIVEALGVKGPADLVLLDLTLPDGDGLQLVEPLRVAGSKQFVGLTGHDDAETRARCLAAGCIDVWVKPVPAREILARTAALLGS